MYRSPLHHLLHELDKAFGNGWLTRKLDLVARYYEDQKQVVLTATGLRQRKDGSWEQRKRITAIVLKIAVEDYELLKYRINHSVAYPITLPSLNPEVPLTAQQTKYVTKMLKPKKYWSKKKKKKQNEQTQAF